MRCSPPASLSRNLLGTLSAGFFFAVTAVCGAGASQEPTKEAELLSDSELVYELSGGIAGIVRSARLVAKGGQVTAEYASNDEPHLVVPQKGPLEPARYLALWKEAERAGLWTLEVPEKTKGADQFQHALRARVGERRHSVSWIDGDGGTTSERNAVLIGERILALARDAAALR
jgi:hypothetical protein